MFNWTSNKNNEDAWELILNSDGNEILNGKITKIYETNVILSGLCCGSLIGLSNSQNEISSIIFAYDIIKCIGIVFSILSSIVSISLSSLLNALPNDKSFKFIQDAIKFTNIPLISTVISLICLLICTSLHFKLQIMYISLPIVIVIIIFSLIFYGTIYKNVYDLIHQN